MGVQSSPVDAQARAHGTAKMAARTRLQAKHAGAGSTVGANGRHGGRRNCAPVHARTTPGGALRQVRSRTVCWGTPAKTMPVIERLEGEDADKWNQCMDVLSEIGLEKPDAEKFLTRAYGWGSQAYWRKEKVEQVPEPENVQACIGYLNELGLEGEDLLGVIKKFPEVLGCDVETRLKANVGVLENQWKMKGMVITNTLKRKPEILGFTIDCYGDCAGECNRCWVRF